MRHRVGHIAILLLAILSLSLAEGCRDSNDPQVDEEFRDFSWEAELDDYTKVESYDFENPNARATVTFEAIHFDGEFRIEIFDDDGSCVYDEIFDRGGHEEEQEPTESGARGDWIIVLTSKDVDGLLKLTVEAGDPPL